MIERLEGTVIGDPVVKKKDDKVVTLERRMYKGHFNEEYEKIHVSIFDFKRKNGNGTYFACDIDIKELLKHIKDFDLNKMSDEDVFEFSKLIENDSFEVKLKATDTFNDNSLLLDSISEKDSNSVVLKWSVGATKMKISNTISFPNESIRDAFMTEHKVEDVYDICRNITKTIQPYMNELLKSQENKRNNL